MSLGCRGLPRKSRRRHRQPFDPPSLHSTAALTACVGDVTQLEEGDGDPVLVDDGDDGRAYLLGLNTELELFVVRVAADSVEPEAYAVAQVPRGLRPLPRQESEVRRQGALPLQARALPVQEALRPEAHARQVQEG